MENDLENSYTSENLSQSSFSKLSLIGPRTFNNKVLLTAGRPPWFSLSEEPKDAFIIGITGGSASGKTTLARSIISALKIPWVVILSLDSFYKVVTSEHDKQAVLNGDFNFDHPDALEIDLAFSLLQKLKEGKMANVPVYDFKTHSRLKKNSVVYGANVIVFEGIHALYDERIRNLMDLKIFVDTDNDTRLARRFSRDIVERGRQLPDIIKQYTQFVKPSFEKYVAPMMKYADLVIPWTKTNHVAVDLVVKHLNRELTKRGFEFRASLKLPSETIGIPENTCLIKQTSQVLGLITMLRNRDTERDNFVFYSQRLMRILLEKAISILPFESFDFIDCYGNNLTGKRFSGQSICGVSIIRAGESMEDALAEICKNVKIGKILIQTNSETFEPELHYIKLPNHISNCHVILMDATAATGAAALMAVRILLDHDVRLDRIIFVNILMSHSAVHVISSVYPSIKIVTSAIDPILNDNYYIQPGFRKFRR